MKFKKTFSDILFQQLIVCIFPMFAVFNFILLNNNQNKNLTIIKKNSFNFSAQIILVINPMKVYQIYYFLLMANY